MALILNTAAACVLVVPEVGDWLQLMSGKLTATAALTSGKLSIEGDLSAAMKLDRWVLPRP